MISKHRSEKAGLPPGTLLQNRTKKQSAEISIIDYTPKTFQEKKVKKSAACAPLKTKKSVSWINVSTVNDVKQIEELGNTFDIHSLVLEDITNTDQRPKTEDHEKYIYTVLKMLSYNSTKGKTFIEQVSILLGDNFVISFQEADGDVFNPIREQIRKNESRIRTSKSDFLAYSLIDSIVDNYFVVLEHIGEKIGKIEEQIFSHPNQHTMEKIHALKRDIIFIRRSVWPLREVINNMQRSESKLIGKESKLYFRDVYDHTIQIMDTTETFSDMLSNLLDVHLSKMTHGMNEVMKVLTIIATVFIPLTFLTGLYGMNFIHMPELQWRYGYPFALGIMLVAALLMLAYFKKKKWF
ncbi:MAG: magnesium/cobalt transporter CorA [Candidatus Jacksonbacteria bacterium]|jgi:magnesium transporter|nr:magnesium/cobalt transporter CorA [Candidatus Jacksonbacteria bacterium]MBT6034589.1 magnesium/cobalt transporter CorA [Candidatus Jacksonbacteria bacterium]MBT6300981.1 magnesium/cobalt transporter CorA [Candidatus Jacksonbacteria bacterium]MBT7008719.1 magnesium/cobalt transporter CorA [Candidatus Jacksonbacteria bacterium]